MVTPEDSGLYEDWSEDGSFDELINVEENGNSLLAIGKDGNHEPHIYSTSSRNPFSNGVPAPPESPTLSGLTPKTQSRPSTRVINHAPGWTMFENLYMSNGTLYIVTSPDEEQSPLAFDGGLLKAEWEHGFPPRRMMTSTGLPGYATEESVREREPTDKDMAFISREDAERRWGDQIWEIGGNTVRIFPCKLGDLAFTVASSGCLTTRINFWDIFM